MSDQPQTPSDNASSSQEPGAAQPAASPTPPPAESAAPPAEPAAMTDKDAHQWAMFCHLSALAMFLGIPFGNILGPLILWLIKKDAHPFVNGQGKEALNFQISMSIYALVSIPLFFICVGYFLMLAVVICDVVFLIMASIASSKGQTYRYPLTIRFIK